MTDDRDGAQDARDESPEQSEGAPRIVIEFQGVSQQVIAQVWEQLNH